jgi:hypothetical protein
MSGWAADGPREEIVSRRVSDILDSFEAWPKNMLLLECEAYGIYQNDSGRILKEMLDSGFVGISEMEIESPEGDDEHQNHDYFTRPQVDEPDVEDVVYNHEQVMAAFHESGHFADLVAYATISKIWDELDGFHFLVWPEGEFEHLLPHTDRKPDAMFQLPQEQVPVEVYNGRDVIDTPGPGYESEKYEQLDGLRADSDGDTHIDSNPFLICRRSTDSIKSDLRSWDGLAVDTGLIVMCDDVRSEYIDELEFFNLEQLIEFVPRFRTRDGALIDGEGYSERALNDDVDDINPEIMAENLRGDSSGSGIQKVPQQYHQRVRGGIHLQYVNSLYRTASGPNQKAASRVIINLYHNLLRSDGLERNQALENAWGETRRKTTSNISQMEEAIRTQADDFLGTLIEQNIVWRDGNTIYARNSEHPVQDLSF